MRFYSYEEFLQDVSLIVKEVVDYNPCAIVAIARGGMTFGHFVAEALESRELYSLNSIHYEESRKLDYIKIFNIPDLSNAKKILLVDDIVDSGETMIEIKRVLNEKFPFLEIKIATLFYKEKALLRPDFSAKEAREWIKFFWDFRVDN